METIDNDIKRKCTNCKVSLPLDHFSIKRNGNFNKQCKRCCEIKAKSREKTKCPHNRQKSICKECGGAHVCSHGLSKSKCRDCHGSQICEHKKNRSLCKDCKGGAICLHNRQRSLCKDCDGGSICKHKRIVRQCIECNPTSYLAYATRNRVLSAFKSKKGLNKLNSYLGCSTETFKEHIEKQFKDGMTWKNHGDWHIDHIIPLMYEKPSIEEVIKRLHYTNTQPLWANENLTKGNRYIR